MRTLLVLLAVVLSLGAYFSDHKTDRESDPERPLCRSDACRAHAPYRRPWAPGLDWPLRPATRDPNCEVESFRRPPRPPIRPPDPAVPSSPGG